LRYSIQGGGQIDLNDQDYLAEGGEGKVYAKGRLVYKIYLDPRKMPPAAKLRELAALDRPNILRPLDIVLDTHTHPVGFSMARLDNPLPLPRLFTNDFRAKRKITPAATIALVEAMRDSIAFIHQHQGFLMVDGNEMNYLVDDQTLATPYLIDVDSYQTPHFPATAQMPSIHDYHSKSFSQLTDWFAFAIIACQLFIGIHPYRGKHPQFPKTDLEARMRANVSIFNPAVSLPSAARDFALIPPDWRDWMTRLFERGERLPPPMQAAAAPMAAPSRRTAQGSGQFSITLLREFPAEIHGFSAAAGKTAIWAGDQLYLGSRAYPLSPAGVIYAPRSLKPLAAQLGRDQMLAVSDLDSGQPLPLQLKAEHLLLANNTVYALYQDNLTEIVVTETAVKLIAGSGNSWKIMPHARLALDGMVYESALGKPYLAIPYQPRACMIRAIPELQGYQILAGKHDNGIAMLIGYQGGRYDRIVLRFNQDYSAHRAAITPDVEYHSVNFATLDNGVCVHIPRDGELEIFHRHADGAKSLQDPQIRADMRLARDGADVLFYLQNKLYGLKMK
jgi:hypothetical protein